MFKLSTLTMWPAGARYRPVSACTQAMRYLPCKVIDNG